MATHRPGDGKSASKTATKSQQMANKYWCDTCGAEYARPFALRLHMKAAHGHTDTADTQLDLEAPTNDDDEFIVPDTETAVLIAAAKSDSSYQPNSLDTAPKYEECIEVSTDGVSKRFLE